MGVHRKRGNHFSFISHRSGSQATGKSQLLAVSTFTSCPIKGTHQPSRVLHRSLHHSMFASSPVLTSTRSPLPATNHSFVFHTTAPVPPPPHDVRIRPMRDAPRLK